MAIACDDNDGGAGQNNNEEGNGLWFAPRCKFNNNDICFISNNDKQCEHIVSKVALDNIGDYVVIPARWYPCGYYKIKPNKIYYTTQLFAKASQNPEAKQNVLRKVNMDMIQGHVDELMIGNLPQDLLDYWDTEYSDNRFLQLLAFNVEKFNATKNRHIQHAMYSSMSE